MLALSQSKEGTAQPIRERAQFENLFKKEEHLVIAHRLAEMEKRRIGTRFLEHEVREEDKAKPLFTTITEACSIM